MPSKIAFWLCTALILSCFCAQAQEKAQTRVNGIHLRYKYYGDSVVLRWGYALPRDWFVNKDKSVAIWRRNVTANGTYEKIAEIRPLDSTTIELQASKMKNPEMMLVVLENLHRNWGNTYFTDYSSIIEKSDNLNNRWSLIHLAADLDSGAARAAGLRFADKNIAANTTYAYKIVAENMADYSVVFPVRRPWNPVIYDVAEEESRIEIRWDKKLHDYHFTAYWIESSGDGITFQRLNQQPYVQMVDENITQSQPVYSYSTKVENYKPVYIRLIGIDAFGDVSQPSEMVRCMGKDKTPPAPGILFADSVATHLSKKLFWTIPSGSDVASCHIERSFKDQVIRIENCCINQQNTYTDKPDAEGIYKYRLVTADTAGNESFSAPVYTKVFDLIPPSKPGGLRAVQDTSGNIILSWDLHPEKDVVGYNIYASDKANRNFVKLNAETSRQRYFVDSIDLYLLTKERYYYIVAVDNDYLRSVPSDTIFVKRPDIIPPSPAIIADYFVRPEGIRLTIFPSSSKDVLKHELWRKSGKEDWKLLETFRTIPSSYTDKSIKAGIDYFYKIYAIDSSGLRSHNVKDIKLTAFPPMGNKPELSYEKGDSGIHIFISYPGQDSVDFLLYKSENKSRTILYKVLKNNQLKENVKSGIQYVYRVRPRNKAGILGPFSDKLTIQM